MTMLIEAENLRLSICGRSIPKGVALHMSAGEIYGVLNLRNSSRNAAVGE